MNIVCPVLLFFCAFRRPPRTTRTDTRLPSTTRFRSIVGIGGAACTAMPYAVTISGTFDKYRGLALGLVVAGSATSAPLFPQVAGRLTETWGWQSNFILLGTISAVVSVIGLTFFVRTPPGAVEIGRAHV